MNEGNTPDLDDLRTQVIRELGTVPNDVPDDQIDIDTLIEIARASTTPAVLLQKAFYKAQTLSDSHQKATILVVVLKELDNHKQGGPIMLPQPEEPQPEESAEEIEVSHDEPEASEQQDAGSAPDDTDPQHVPIQYD